VPFCPHCGNDLSPLATVCRRCGRPTTGISEVAISYGDPDLRPASFWVRLGGFVIDGLIVAVLFLLVSSILRLPSVIVTGPTFDASDPRYAFDWTIDRGALMLRQLAGALSAVAYSASLIAFNRGRTLGCMAVGARVAGEDGSPLGIGRALGRQTFAVLSRVPLYLGYLWAAWDRGGKTWHDHVAGTKVFLSR
jgi:uncharacterized RDD family membrane protein YckC